MRKQVKKLSKSESDKILSAGVFQKCKVIYREKETQTVVKAKFVKLAQEPEKIYILPQQVIDLKERKCTLGFNVGTQVFLLRAQVKFSAKGFYVSDIVNIYELSGRRDIRFETNRKYPIESQIVYSKDGKALADAYLLNLSQSGASLIADTDTMYLKKNKEVILSIRPDQGTNFTVHAIIRYASVRPNDMTEVGIEFLKMDDSQHRKVINICDDLSRFIFSED